MATVLIVDDSKTTREYITMILKEEGYRTLEAKDGNVCLEVLKEEEPTLVIMDIVMPEKEGIETIIILKKQYPNIPVLAVSGAALSDSYLNNAKRLGADLTLNKPFTKEELLVAINKVLKN